MKTDLRSAPSGSASGLVVLLPGLNMRCDEFVAHGFVDALHQTAAVDVLLAEPELPSYLDGAVGAVLAQLVAERNASYRRIWLAGISLGCFGAVLAAAAGAPGAIDGLVLLSPFLGTPGLLAEVERAGSLDRWEPGPIAANDAERRALRWLQRHTQTPGEKPDLWLGYGTADRFASSHARLAASLPPQRTHAIDGGHDWPTWERLWQLILASRPIGEAAQT